jgi:catechol 2,3-dioxygenase-like lactoylglutathione lyase family enzyme
MQVINKLIMINVAVSDMPKAKEFYGEKLGLKVVQEYRQDDENWYVSFDLPDGVTITLNTTRGEIKPTLVGYFSTSDIEMAHKELSSKEAKVSDVKDDLFGPGSGAKWFDLQDPDGNHLQMTQAKSTPFATR